MIAQKIIDQINEQFNGIVKNNPLTDIEANFKTILLSVLEKLDLVTRDEFDIQQQVLIKTREKVEQLEQKIKQLEQLIK